VLLLLPLPELRKWLQLRLLMVLQLRLPPLLLLRLLLRTLLLLRQHG
jgi:hypothetical protein